MGNKLELDSKIGYKTAKGETITFLFKDLKGHTNFPKLPPKEKDITTMFNNLMKNVSIYNIQVVLDKKEKEILNALPPKYKFRMCIKHEQKMKEL